MIRQFWHVGLSVEDIGQAIEQYAQLGFELVDRFEKDEPQAFAAEMKHPKGSSVELWQWVDYDNPQVKFIKQHAAFISDDQDADVQSLVERGWEVVIPKTTGVKVTYVFLRDPSGNYIEIADVKE